LFGKIPQNPNVRELWNFAHTTRGTTGKDTYLNRARTCYLQMGFENQSATRFTWSLGWNDQAYAVYVQPAGG
jgi:hypothetical protein